MISMEKIIQKKFLFAGLCLSLFSCQNYKTIPIDPLYKEAPLGKESLPLDSLHYLPRIHEYSLAQVGKYPLEKGEGFYQYEERLGHTFLLQKSEQEQLERENREKEEELELLKGELATARARQLQLYLQLISQKRAGEQREPLMGIFSLYQVEEGDTLQKIALHHYGTHTAWLLVYRFNRDRLKHGPNYVQAGEKLLLPDIQIDRDLYLHSLRREKEPLSL